MDNFIYYHFFHKDRYEFTINGELLFVKNCEKQTICLVISEEHLENLQKLSETIFTCLKHWELFCDEIRIALDLTKNYYISSIHLHDGPTFYAEKEYSQNDIYTELQIFYK